MAPLSERDRVLRTITLLAWVPAMALLIPFGVASQQVVPSLGLVPMTASALQGFEQIYSKRPDRVRTFILDLFIGAFLLGIIIPGLIIIGFGHYRYGNRGPNGMFGAFATMPMMLNFCIHAFFVLVIIYDYVRSRFGPNTCPHCSKNIGTISNLRTSARSKENYAALPQEYLDGDAQPGPSMDSAPRPSTDDETARLV